MGGLRRVCTAAHMEHETAEAAEAALGPAAWVGLYARTMRSCDMESFLLPASVHRRCLAAACGRKRKSPITESTK